MSDAASPTLSTPASLVSKDTGTRTTAIDLIRRLVKPFASIKLTVALMFASTVLIFVGTIAQVDRGLWAVMEDYFRSVFVMVPIAMLVPGDAGDALKDAVPGLVFPWPGGATLGALLLLNLIAAHAVRFTVSARGPRLITGILISIAGIAAVAIAFFVPSIANWLATHGVVPLFAVGSLFFLPLMLGTSIVFGRRFGIVLVHASLILLLVSEGITAMTALESQMPIYEGEAIQWSQDIREFELAIVKPGPTPTDDEQVWVIRQHALERAERTGEPIDLSTEQLPVRVNVQNYMNNSRLLFKRPEAAAAAQATQATHGFAAERFYADELSEASGVTGSMVDVASAVVSFTDTDGNALGTFLVSGNLEDPNTPFKPLRQSFTLRDGTTLDTVLRFRRHYKPYTLELVDFRHDLYPGTQTPRNFSSDVLLRDNVHGVERAVHIKMNEPMRYRGETFFQANWIKGVDGGSDRGTVLQVVDNPGWTVPYIACIVGGLGLCAHFVLSLVSYRQRTAQSEAKRAGKRPSPNGTAHEDAIDAPRTNRLTPIASSVWVLPACVGLIALGYLLSGVGRSAQPPTIDGYRVHDIGQLAASYGGRFKPLDSVARDTLLAISNKSTLMRGEERLPATRWLLDAITGRPDPATGQAYAMNDRVFRVDHPDLKHLLGVVDSSRKLFSASEVEPHLAEIERLANEARQRDSRERSPFDNKVIELQNHVGLYAEVASLSGLHMVPPAGATDASNEREDWRPLREAIASSSASESAGDAKLALYDQALAAYQHGRRDTFNAAAAALLAEQSARFPDLATRAWVERFFNAYQPFMKSMALYVGAGLCVLASWLIAPRLMLRVAVVCLMLALLVHTAGLVTRVYLSGRPPVTNLYSSAVFIGWGVVILGLLIERVTKMGLGYLVAAMSGVGTLLVARGLDDGDTMAVLQAVLDTNFWLATHVIIITLGYSAMFVAGLLGLFYLVGGVYTQALRDPSRERRLRGSIYGITCFALLLSFVGTILGGIWADQSWGRFWGWDPKENGAMMIVLWGAMLLHARWGKMIEGPGIAALAVLGNVVTAWSWFGVNMLGTGLHSYGFIDSAVFWLLAFVVSQVTLASVALIPRASWASFGPRRRAVPEAS